MLEQAKQTMKGDLDIVDGEIRIALLSDLGRNIVSRTFSLDPKDSKRNSTKEKNSEYKIKMTGSHASNDGDLVRRWCVAGKGLAVKSCLDMSADLLSGNVVSVMPEFKPRATELWIVCPSRQSITPAIRLLRDFLREKSKVILNQLIEKEIVDHSVFE